MSSNDTWKKATSVAPLSCRVGDVRTSKADREDRQLQRCPHGLLRAGRMKVVMDDGEEAEYGPGDFAIMAPGHDAWVVGEDPCVFVDWQGFTDYAKG